jgi:putative DNA primase/helicase
VEEDSVSLVQAALIYARRGLRVFPCANKIPLTGVGGFKNATRDEEKVLDWWKRQPDAQIGLPTGQINHLFVLDVDGEEGAAQVGTLNLPETFTVETRPGRAQYWFRIPDGVPTKCTAGELGPQIDTRGDGGYTIAPPSIHHATGKPYRVIKKLPWAEAPAHLLALKNGANRLQHSISPERIPRGQRHHTLLSISGALRHRGLSASAILDTLNTVSLLRCDPPLDLGELEKIAGWVGNKPVSGYAARLRETSAEIELESFADVTPVRVDWLWPKRVPIGFLTLFVGDPGQGKSLATIDLAARISTANEFPDGSKAPLGDVILLSAEDSAERTIRPRLDVAGTDVRRVHRIKAVRVTLADGAPSEAMFDLDRDLQKLEETIEKFPAVKLLVIDPISSYLPERIDSHRDAPVRRVLSPLAEFAERRKIAVIAIMHLRKSDTTALLRVSGSVAFVAAARVVWGFGKNPETNAPCMVPIKNNLAALGEGIGHIIEEVPHGVGMVPRLVWGKAVSASADEVLNSELRNKGDRQDGKAAEAQEWLLKYLADGNPKPCEQVRAAADAAGITRRTLERAKKESDVKTVWHVGDWNWVLK